MSTPSHFHIHSIPTHKDTVTHGVEMNTKPQNSSLHTGGMDTGMDPRTTPPMTPMTPCTTWPTRFDTHGLLKAIICHLVCCSYSHALIDPTASLVVTLMAYPVLSVPAFHPGLFLDPASDCRFGIFACILFLALPSCFFLEVITTIVWGQRSRKPII